MLESLLRAVYREIYTSDAPTFKVHVDPSLTAENLVTFFDADMLSVPDTSRLMQSGMGVSLAAAAEGARADRRKAENVLPFRDKVGAPKG